MSLDNIIDKIKEEKEFTIYGAGKYANIFYTYIRLENLEDHIKCFAVTDVAGNPKEIYGKEVRRFSDLENKDGLIILTLGEKASKQVGNLLAEEGFYNVKRIEQEDICELQNRIFAKFQEKSIQRDTVFMECFAGQGYGCNCKYIAQELIRSNDKIKIVWGVNYPQDNIPKQIKQVKRFSYDYFEGLYTSGIYISNTGHEMHFRKRREQYYINTWHGSGPFKKVSASLYEGNIEKQKEFEDMFRIVDLLVSNTGDNTQMFRESFCYHGEIYECGSPRNDIFFIKNNIRNELCDQLQIKSNKKIVLYAPTFRADYERSFESYDLDMNRVIAALEKRFGAEFVLLYRFHYTLLNFEKGRNFYPNAINVTLYPDMQELLVASDVLITDYSSSMWDFSLQDRPIFLYQNDEAEYENDRGFYCPVSKWPYVKAHSTDEMVEAIENFDEENYLSELHAFIKKYKTFDDGHASERVVERIMDVIAHPRKYNKE